MTIRNNRNIHNNHNNDNRLRGRTYYWIVANVDGQLAVIGPRDVEAEANAFAYEKLDVEFEIVPLQTRDRAKATRVIKARLLGQTGDIRKSLQRARHKM